MAQFVYVLLQFMIIYHKCLLLVNGLEKECPSQEIIQPCQCQNSDSKLIFECYTNINTTHLNSILRYSNKSMGELHIYNGNLSKLSARPFQDHNLTLIRLENSSLDQLMGDTFKNLDNSLEHLYLGHNFLKSIPNQMFKQLKVLKTLDVSHNELSKLNYGMLRTLKNLTIINLERNKLTNIDGLFVDLPSLETIILDYNNIGSLAANTFNSLANLKNLSISHNGIKLITSGAVKNVPNLISINMNNNNLREVTVLLTRETPLLQNLQVANNQISLLIKVYVQNLPHLTKLNIKGNSIQNLYHNLGIYKALTELKTLDISNNKIKELKKEYFEDFSSIENLDLSRNEISQIANNVFENFTNLTILSLGSNKLKEIKRPFAKLINIQYLDLSNNSINKIDTSSLLGLANLMYLDLSGNNLTTIPTTLLSSGISLKELYLSNNSLIEVPQLVSSNTLENLGIDGNKITTLSDSTFAIYNNLKSLNLKRNQISEIAPDAFSELSSLYFLDISYNQLKSISGKIFNHLQNITSLYLSSNNISEIDQNAFVDLQRISDLDLNHNQIQRLQYEVFEPLEDIYFNLHLADNKIICDCGSKWLQDWFKKHSQKQNKNDQVNASNVECYEPENLKARNLMELNQEDFDCSASEKNKDTKDSPIRNKNIQIEEQNNVPNKEGVNKKSTNEPDDNHTSDNDNEYDKNTAAESNTNKPDNSEDKNTNVENKEDNASQPNDEVQTESFANRNNQENEAISTANSILVDTTETVTDTTSTSDENNKTPNLDDSNIITKTHNKTENNKQNSDNNASKDISDNGDNKNNKFKKTGKIIDKKTKTDVSKFTPELKQNVNQGIKNINFKKYKNQTQNYKNKTGSVKSSNKENKKTDQIDQTYSDESSTIIDIDNKNIKGKKQRDEIIDELPLKADNKKVNFNNGVKSTTSQYEEMDRASYSVTEKNGNDQEALYNDEYPNVGEVTTENSNNNGNEDDLKSNGDILQNNPSDSIKTTKHYEKEGESNIDNLKASTQVEKSKNNNNEKSDIEKQNKNNKFTNKAKVEENLKTNKEINTSNQNNKKKQMNSDTNKMNKNRLENIQREQNRQKQSEITKNKNFDKQPKINDKNENMDLYYENIEENNKTLIESEKDIEFNEDNDDYEPKDIITKPNENENNEQYTSAPEESKKNKNSNPNISQLSVNHKKEMKDNREQAENKLNDKKLKKDELIHFNHFQSSNLKLKENKKSFKNNPITTEDIQNDDSSIDNNNKTLEIEENVDENKKTLNKENKQDTKSQQNKNNQNSGNTNKLNVKSNNDDVTNKNNHIENEPESFQNNRANSPPSDVKTEQLLKKKTTFTALKGKLVTKETAFSLTTTSSIIPDGLDTEISNQSIWETLKTDPIDYLSIDFSDVNEKPKIIEIDNSKDHLNDAAFLLPLNGNNIPNSSVSFPSLMTPLKKSRKFHKPHSQFGDSVTEENVISSTIAYSVTETNYLNPKQIPFNIFVDFNGAQITWQTLTTIKIVHNKCSTNGFKIAVIPQGITHHYLHSLMPGACYRICIVPLSHKGYRKIPPENCKFIKTPLQIQI